MEGMHAGRITCVVSPEPSMLVTDGSDTTVRLWHFECDKTKTLHSWVKPIKTLCGHTGMVVYCRVLICLYHLSSTCDEPCCIDIV